MFCISNKEIKYKGEATKLNNLKIR